MPTPNSNKQAELEIYAANVRQLILKIERLKKVEIAETDLVLQTQDWTELFYDEIPLERLQETYLRETRMHKTPYFINAFDILRAYRELIAEEKSVAEKIEIEARKKMSSIEKCVNARDHLNDRGDRLYLGMFGKFDLKLACVDCRRTAYFQQRERYFNKLRLRNARIILFFSIISQDILTASMLKKLFL
jgi:hypothetical protein